MSGLAALWNARELDAGSTCDATLAFYAFYDDADVDSVQVPDLETKVHLAVLLQHAFFVRFFGTGDYEEKRTKRFRFSMIDTTVSRAMCTEKLEAFVRCLYFGHTGDEFGHHCEQDVLFALVSTALCDKFLIHEGYRRAAHALVAGINYDTLNLVFNTFITHHKNKRIAITTPAGSTTESDNNERNTATTLSPIETLEAAMHRTRETLSTRAVLRCRYLISDQLCSLWDDGNWAAIYAIDLELLLSVLDTPSYIVWTDSCLATFAHSYTMRKRRFWAVPVDVLLERFIGAYMTAADGLLRRQLGAERHAALFTRMLKRCVNYQAWSERDCAERFRFYFMLPQTERANFEAMRRIALTGLLTPLTDDAISLFDIRLYITRAAYADNSHPISQSPDDDDSDTPWFLEPNHLCMIDGSRVCPGAKTIFLPHRSRRAARHSWYFTNTTNQRCRHLSTDTSNKLFLPAWNEVRDGTGVFIKIGL